MRKAVANTLTKWADESRDFTVLTSDLGYSIFDDFRSSYPDKFFNMGIAENNMVGVGAGLALTGQKVFIYSIATFLAAKCFEQIRDDVCYHNAPVILIGTGAGFSYGQAGYTHYSNDDLAILRTIPDLTILSPSDPVELQLLLNEVIDYDSPVYIRIGKNGEPNFSQKTKLRIGEAYYYYEGNKVAIVSHGVIMGEAAKLKELLLGDGIDASVVSSPTIKPVDETFFKNLKSKHDRIIVIEEHYQIGGLGSALKEIGIPVDVYGVKDRIFYEGGDQDYLRRLHGIDAQSVYDAMKEETNV